MCECLRMQLRRASWRSVSPCHATACTGRTTIKRQFSYPTARNLDSSRCVVCVMICFNQRLSSQMSGTGDVIAVTDRHRKQIVLGDHAVGKLSRRWDAWDCLIFKHQPFDWHQISPQQTRLDIIKYCAIAAADNLKPTCHAECDADVVHSAKFHSLHCPVNSPQVINLCAKLITNVHEHISRHFTQDNDQNTLQAWYCPFAGLPSCCEPATQATTGTGIHSHGQAPQQ